MTAWPKSGVAFFAGRTWHGRRAWPANAFDYAVDFLLLRMAPAPARLAISAARFAPLSVCDRDHGEGSGAAVDWARRAAVAHGLPADAMTEIWLLTQPRRFGYVFNPVSFWFFQDAGGAVRAVLAEVNNTFGDRHSYFCARQDFAALDATAVVTRPKRMHVSPFQEVAGEYAFTFEIAGDRIDIAIDYRKGAGGMRATLSGHIRPLDWKARLQMSLRQFGPFRVIVLIHWQAAKLACKGARFWRRPSPPNEEFTG